MPFVGELDGDGLVDAVFGGGAGVGADGAEGVAPGAAADGEGDVGEGCAEGEDVDARGKLVSKGAARPDWAGGE